MRATWLVTPRGRISSYSGCTTVLVEGVTTPKLQRQPSMSAMSRASALGAAGRDQEGALRLRHAAPRPRAPSPACRATGRAWRRGCGIPATSSGSATAARKAAAIQALRSAGTAFGTATQRLTPQFTSSRPMRAVHRRRARQEGRVCAAGDRDRQDAVRRQVAADLAEEAEGEVHVVAEQRGDARRRRPGTAP